MSDRITNDGVDEVVVATYSIANRARAEGLWQAVIADLEAQATKSGKGAVRAGEKAARLRAAFGHGEETHIAVVAEYLSAMQIGALSADRLRELGAQAEQAMRAVQRLADDLRAAHAGLEFSDTKFAGASVLEAAWWASSFTDQAATAMQTAVEHVERIGALMPHLTADKRRGTDGAMRRAPDETLARGLAMCWAGRGMTAKGGVSGDGLDDILAFIVEAVDAARKPGGSRKKWLDEGLMTVARDTIKQFVNTH